MNRQEMITDILDSADEEILAEWARETLETYDTPTITEEWEKIFRGQEE